MLIPTEPIWIDQDDQLAPLCARWREQAAIAVDTEFMRSETFYPIAGLLQIGDGKGCYLIDPLTIRNLEPLRNLLTDANVTKVLHSCSEDLEVFQQWLGVLPAPLFDTQLAAAFAGLGYSLGYSALVKALLDIEIPKDETRSDWLQRPLSIAQLKYAALDVAHMLVLYGKLLQRLKASNRLEWVKQDCADLIANFCKTHNVADGFCSAEGSQLADGSQPAQSSQFAEGSQLAEGSPFADAYQKVGFAWKLRPQELAVLRDLCIWRETQARARNVPRNRLMKEPTLWELARRKVQDLAQLQKIPDLPARTLANDGDTILNIIARVLASPAESWPARLSPPLSQSEGPLLKALKNVVREKAAQADLPAELLIRKKDYEFIVRSRLSDGTFQLPPRLQGWRFSVIGEALLNAAQARGQGAPSDKVAPDNADAGNGNGAAAVSKPQVSASSPTRQTSN